MGVNIALVDEHGNTRCFLDGSLGLGFFEEVARRPDLLWTATIDPYGDTTFNHLQAAHLRTEWSLLIARTHDPTKRTLMVEIDKLLERCAAGDHEYVKFIGD